MRFWDLRAETGEIKGHYLNATAGTCEEMIKRAVFARELGLLFFFAIGKFLPSISISCFLLSSSRSELFVRSQMPKLLHLVIFPVASK
jgi:hypothetical protein